MSSSASYPFGQTPLPMLRERLTTMRGQAQPLTPWAGEYMFRTDEGGLEAVRAAQRIAGFDGPLSIFREPDGAVRIYLTAEEMLATMDALASTGEAGLVGRCHACPGSCEGYCTALRMEYLGRLGIVELT